MGSGTAKRKQTAAGRARLRAGGFGATGAGPGVGRRITPRPILLDLDGNGIRITEQSRSGVFVDAGGDGLLHRTAWAGAGDGVLFFDPDGSGAITEKRQYVFTEWGERRKRNGPADRFRQRTRRAPTATDDLAALRSVFDSNGDGVLNASDAAFASFKVMVTNADGSTTSGCFNRTCCADRLAGHWKRHNLQFQLL